MKYIVLILSIFFYNSCDGLPKPTSQDEFISIQTVEESDALKYATKILNNGARTKNNIILPSLDGKSLTYKSIVGSNVTLPVFNTNTDSNVLSEFFLIKENNEIKGYYSFF